MAKEAGANAVNRPKKTKALMTCPLIIILSGVSKWIHLALSVIDRVTNTFPLAPYVPARRA